MYGTSAELTAGGTALSRKAQIENEKCRSFVLETDGRMNLKTSKRAELHERTIHGRTNFPFAVYHGRIPEWLAGFSLHWHEEFEIITVTFGSGFVTVNGTRFFCRKGDIVLIPSGAVHSIEQDGTKKLAYYNILFSLSLLEENPDSLCSRRFLCKFENAFCISDNIVKAGTKLQKTLEPLVKDLTLLWEGDVEKNALLVKARLFEILHILSGENILIKTDTASKKEIQRHERLKKILLYVKEHFSEKLSVEDAAEIASLSPSRFMKVFAEETGMSFIQYVNDYRLEQAAEEIRTQNKSITKIAQENGFESSSYFTLLFRRKFKVTPAEYRIQ